MPSIAKEIEAIIANKSMIKVHLTVPSTSGVGGENFWAEPLGVTQNGRVIARVDNVLFFTDTTTLDDVIKVRRGKPDECAWIFVKVIKHNRLGALVRYATENKTEEVVKARWKVTQEYFRGKNVCMQGCTYGFAAIAYPVDKTEAEMKDILDNVPKNGLVFLASDVND